MEQTSAYYIGRVVGAILFPIIIGSIAGAMYARVSKKSFSWKITLIVAVVVFILARIGQAGNTLSQLQKQEDAGFKTNYTSGFVSECSKNGYDVNVCNCIAQKLTTSYTAEELTKLSADIKAGKYKSADEMPEKFKAAFTECVPTPSLQPSPSE